MKKTIIAIAILIVGYSALYIPIPISPKGVKIETFDMQYACGDCYTNDHIIAIQNKENILVGKNHPTAKNGDLYRYLDTDIVVFYNGNDQIGSDIKSKVYEVLPTDDENNVPHCNFATSIFQGQLKRKLIYAFKYRGSDSVGVYFVATGGKIKVEPSSDKRCRKYEEKYNNKIFGSYSE